MCPRRIGQKAEHKTARAGVETAMAYARREWASDDCAIVQQGRFAYSFDI